MFSFLLEIKKMAKMVKNKKNTLKRNNIIDAIYVAAAVNRSKIFIKRMNWFASQSIP